MLTWARTHTGIQARLGFMLLLQYFIWGSWYVTFGTWLGTALHFSGSRIAFAAGATAIGALVAPLIAGALADRHVATERLLALLHLLGAIALVTVSLKHTFVWIYPLTVLYACCYMPTLALTNTLAFRQMDDPSKEFPPLRVLGTIGWILAGLLVGGLGLEASASPLRIAALASLAMAAYCLTLPHTPPSPRSNQAAAIASRPVWAELLNLLRDRSFAVFAIASLLICIPLQFYYAFTNLFLNQKGVHDAAGKMTGGQFSELLCMLAIPWFFRRLGVKGMLVAGMAAWILRYVCFAYANNAAGVGLLWSGILLHGICYDFFFVTGQIYVDAQTPPAIRSAAQGLLTQITYGAGMLAGSWVSGLIVDHYTVVGTTMHLWRPIWLDAAACSALVLCFFALFFHNPSRKHSSVPQTETLLTRDGVASSVYTQG
jgi:nucleoside transporter